MGLGIARVIASTAAPASDGSSSSARPGVLIAPRPTIPSAWPSASRSATGPGCSRRAHRGRRQISAADAEAASTPAPAGSSASMPSSSRRSSGAAVEYSESDSAPYGLASGPRLPINAGRPGRSSQVLASRCHRSAGDIAVYRSTADRRRPKRRVAGGGFRIGLAAGDQRCRRGDLEDQAQPRLVDAGRLRQPFDVAHSQPAATQLGNRCGAKDFEQHVEFAQQVDGGSGRGGVAVLRTWWSK